MVLPVILLNFNSSADCRICIEFLHRQEGIEIEIIVVDNCSKKDERDKIEQLCEQHQCTLLVNTINNGFNAGNNVGLYYAQEKGYEYALIANPDVEFPQKDYLARLLEAMISDKRIAVCGSDIVTPEGFHQNPLKEEDRREENFSWLIDCFSKSHRKERDFIGNYLVSHYCGKVSGCCFLVRMSFVKEIGFFDEYPFLYCEETILSKQIERSKKWKIYYFSNVQAVHRHVKKEKGNPCPRLRQWRRSRIYVIRQYSDRHWLSKMIAILSVCLYIRIVIIKSYITFRIR